LPAENENAQTEKYVGAREVEFTFLENHLPLNKFIII